MFISTVPAGSRPSRGPFDPLARLRPQKTTLATGLTKVMVVPTCETVCWPPTSFGRGAVQGRGCSNL
eukprot:15475882-Alexandrium_andersonii.AAC.1